MSEVSRGLGKAERYVLDYFAEWGGSHLTVRSIANRRAHDDWMAESGQVCANNHDCCDHPSYEPTPSEYESIRRAVRSLEKKGYLDRDVGGWSSL